MHFRTRQGVPKEEVAYCIGAQPLGAGDLMLVHPLHKGSKEGLVDASCSGDTVLAAHTVQQQDQQQDHHQQQHHHQCQDTRNEQSTGVGWEGVSARRWPGLEAKLQGSDPLERLQVGSRTS